MTRRMRGEGAVFQRKSDGQWVGQVEVGWVGGIRKRKTVYGRTQREVLRKLGDARRQLAEHGGLPTADITVSKWLDYWLEEIAARRVKPKTLEGYRSVVRTYLTPALGSKRLGKLAPQNVREMHRYVTNPKPLGLGLSTTTALNAHRVLAASLTDAMREGRVSRNVATLVDAPAKAANLRTGMSAADARKILDTAKHEPLGSRWDAALMLGIRQGERLGLRWSDVDLTTSALRISWSLTRIRYAHGCRDKDGNATCRARRGSGCPKRIIPIPAGLEHEILESNFVLLRPKSQRSLRWLPIPPQLAERLRARYREVLRGRPGYEVDHDLVWCDDKGHPIDSHDDWEDWGDILEKAEVAEVTLHEARHTTATLLQDLGIPEQIIQAILGHSSVLTTRGYAHVLEPQLRAAMNTLGNALAIES